MPEIDCCEKYLFNKIGWNGLYGTGRITDKKKCNQNKFSKSILCSVPYAHSICSRFTKECVTKKGFFSSVFYNFMAVFCRKCCPLFACVTKRNIANSNKWRKANISLNINYEYVVYLKTNSFLHLFIFTKFFTHWLLTKQRMYSSRFFCTSLLLLMLLLWTLNNAFNNLL